MTRPRIEDLFEAFTSRLMRLLRVADVAEVLTYDAATQRATVQPWVHEGRYDEDGTRQTSRPTAITNVPVTFPGTADGFRSTVPLAKGDTVLLIYVNRSLDQWLQRGGAVDPLDDRQHRPDDAVAIPCVRAFPHALEEVGSLPAIGYPNALVEFTDDQIQAGGTGKLARKADLDTFMTALASAIASLGGGFAPELSALQTALTSAGFPVGTSTLRGA